MFRCDKWPRNAQIRPASKFAPVSKSSEKEKRLFFFKTQNSISNGRQTVVYRLSFRRIKLIPSMLYFAEGNEMFILSDEKWFRRLKSKFPKFCGDNYQSYPKTDEMTSSKS